MYLEHETDEEVKHGDDEDQEIKYQELLEKAGLLEAEVKPTIKAVKPKVQMVMIICSCGSPKCYAIRRFGLPEPTFKKEIQPLYPQTQRDVTALRIKALG